jgi:hypothetical protein
MRELRIYDVAIDDYRPATQRDMDCFKLLNRAYGAIRFAYKQAGRTPEQKLAAIEEAHQKLMEAVGKLSE